MASHKKPVTRQEPCPICGKPDYCWWRERDNEPGYFNLYCNRTLEAKGTVVAGLDGKDYIAVFQRDTGTVFQSVAERKEMFGKDKVGTGPRKDAAPRQFTVIDSVEELPHEKLDMVYRALMEILPLQKFHAEYLLHEGWSMELIKKHGICSMPVKYFRQTVPSMKRSFISREVMAQKVMEKLGWNSLQGVPGAYINKKGSWVFNSLSGIIFPVYDEDGLIFRLRLRMDYLDLPVEEMKQDAKGFYFEDNGRVDVTMGGASRISSNGRVKVEFESHKGKYRPLTSFKMDEAAYKDGFIQNTFQKGCESGNVLGYVMDSQDSNLVFWITEGEKKGMYANCILKQPILILPGVNSLGLLVKSKKGITPMDIMKKKGAKVAVIAFDADKAVNKMVMLCHDKLADMLLKNGFLVFSAEWDMADGKGLDDLLATGKKPRFKRITK